MNSHLPYQLTKHRPKEVVETLEQLGFEVPHRDLFPSWHARKYFLLKNGTIPILSQYTQSPDVLHAAKYLSALLFFAMNQPQVWAVVANPMDDPRSEKAFYRLFSNYSLFLEAGDRNLTHLLLFGVDILSNPWFNWGYLAFNIAVADQILRKNARPAQMIDLTTFFLEFKDSVEINLDSTPGTAIASNKPVYIATLPSTLRTPLFCFEGWTTMNQQWSQFQRVVLPAHIFTLKESEEILLSEHMRPLWQKERLT